MNKILPFFVINFFKKRKTEKEAKKKKKANQLIASMNKEKSSHNVTVV